MRAAGTVGAVLLVLLIEHGGARAHAVNPAVLSVRELSPRWAEVLWTVVPVEDDAELATEPVLPAECREVSPRRRERTGDRIAEYWSVSCPGGLVGKRLTARNFGATESEVLVRLELEDGRVIHRVLRRGSPAFVVPARDSRWTVVGSYVWLGIEHILGGLDHLVFVFALLLLVTSRRRLLLAVTAFTLAHSVTLTAAALGFVRVAPAPIEVAIAMSIAFLAAELLARESEERQTLGVRYPWVVAFAFGLLHGFGFAGGLLAVGLPPGDVPIALVGFNAGVEIGQLLFLGGALAVLRGARWVSATARARAPQLRRATAYAMGSAAAYWCVERAAVLWSARGH